MFIFGSYVIMIYTACNVKGGVATETVKIPWEIIHEQLRITH